LICMAFAGAQNANTPKQAIAALIDTFIVATLTLNKFR